MSKQVRAIYTVQTLEQVTAQHVEYVLSVYGWNMTRTALAIGVDRRTLYRMVARHGIQRPAELEQSTEQDEA